MKLIASLLLTFALAILPVGAGFIPQIANASELSYSGHPTISIVSVDRDNSVTIRARNLPPDDDFRVRMNWMGTRGIGGTIVDEFGTGNGGTQTFTFDIPSKFHGERQIAHAARDRVQDRRAQVRAMVVVQHEHDRLAVEIVPQVHEVPVLVTEREIQRHLRVQLLIERDVFDRAGQHGRELTFQLRRGRRIEAAGKFHGGGLGLLVADVL